MSIENTPEPTEGQSARLDARRADDLGVVEMAILRGMRCASGYPTLKEIPPQADEIKYARHTIYHASASIQWALMRDAADLIDIALLAEIDSEKASPPPEWQGTLENWEAIQTIVTSTTISLLEMLGNEFRELADVALADDPESQS